MITWPKPVQKPHPPIIVVGVFRLAARRAIRYGDGLLPAAPSAGSAAPSISCRACGIWRKKLDATRNRCR
jgi:alkanesulfonate monooxygenase SsuD/methylene tetrahydromethanopterin reductase-like flavin-dependent oxidoreductase (luciferase family)